MADLTASVVLCPVCREPVMTHTELCTENAREAEDRRVRAALASLRADYEALRAGETR